MLVDLATIRHEAIAGPGVVCAFDSRECTTSMAHAGGFDLHHPWPKGMGGAEEQVELALCPNHHRRQHALIRSMVESDLAGRTPSYAVLRRFQTAERAAAAKALGQWVGAGRPPITGWPALAAT